MTLSSERLERLRALRGRPGQHTQPAPSLPPTPRPVPPPVTVPPDAIPPTPSRPPRPVLNRPPASQARPAVKGAEVVAKSDNLSAPSPKVLDLMGLPAQLGQLVGMAQAGKLPSGPQQLASGLVLDLGGYVVAWAECWPRDREHVQRRLLEAYEVTNHDH